MRHAEFISILITVVILAHAGMLMQQNEKPQIKYLRLYYLRRIIVISTGVQRNGEIFEPYYSEHLKPLSAYRHLSPERERTKKQITAPCNMLHAIGTMLSA
jgi:hypothetical protein